MKLKNVLIRALVATIKPFIPKNLPSEVRRILVVCPTALGDTIWGTPAIRALRNCFPNAKIHALTSPIGSSVLKNNPHLDSLLVLKGNPLIALPKLLPSLWRLKVDSVVIFHLSQRLIPPFCALSGASHIVGTRGINKGQDHFLTKALHDTKVHEIERRFEIIEAIGAKRGSFDMELFPTKEDEAELNAFLKEQGVSKKTQLIGLHPGAQEKFKMWPPEYFAKIGSAIAQRDNVRVFISGTIEEKGITHPIANKIKNSILLDSKLSLGAFALLLDRTHTFVTNDTGPMHMARARNTKLIALFGPTNPKLCGPGSASHINLLSNERTCWPCLRKKCRAPFCMRQISVEDVLRLI